LEAAAALWVARRVVLLCRPGLGLQLPLLRGFLPGTGSKPGQQGFFWVVFFAVAMFLLEADGGVFVEGCWHFGGGTLHDF
jgi:hypothetical protein